MANIAEQLPDELTLAKLYAHEHESVTAFYHKYYCSEAPACSDESKMPDEALEDLILQVKRDLLQDDGVSVAIKEKSSSRLIACSINTIFDDATSPFMDDGQKLHETDSDHCKMNPRIKIAEGLFPDYLAKSKALHFGIHNAVDKEFCNRSLEFLMLQKSEQLAIEQGCKCVIMAEMGPDTQAILESMGYHKFYEKYIDSNSKSQFGALIFDDRSLNTRRGYFYKTLDEN